MIWNPDASSSLHPTQRPITELLMQKYGIMNTQQATATNEAHAEVKLMIKHEKVAVPKTKQDIVDQLCKTAELVLLI